jgi:hypothetical protein
LWRVPLAFAIGEKSAQLPFHVHLNISLQRHLSNKKDNPKSVTYSDARSEFARAATDFESDVGRQLRAFGPS